MIYPSISSALWPMPHGEELRVLVPWLVSDNEDEAQLNTPQKILTVPTTELDSKAPHLIDEGEPIVLEILRD